MKVFTVATVLCALLLNGVRSQYGDAESPPTATTENPCNLVDCMPNKRCILVKGKATCVSVTDGGGCNANEERKTCPSACEPACPKLPPSALSDGLQINVIVDIAVTFDDPNPCKKPCVNNTCQCKGGYIREKDGGACIPYSKCPKERIRSCAEMKCPVGTTCQLGQEICPYVPPCYNRQSQCVPDHPQPKVPLYYKDTCANKKCPPGTECQQEIINCIKFPCPEPKPECVKKDTSLETCLTKLCPPGYECQETTLNCFVAPCPRPPGVCVPRKVSPGQETCLTKKCPTGQECQEIALNCFVAPCPPPPVMCVPKEAPNPCAATTCLVGSECRVKNVQCIRAPCDPVAECYTPPGNKQCRQNETFKECSSQCEPTCSNKTPICILSCGTPKCQCSPGFFRHSNGKCVTEADCDASSNTNPY